MFSVKIPQNSFYAMAGILLFLSSATLFVLLIKKFNKSKDHSELFLRIRSWWFILIPLFVVLSINDTVFIITFCIMSLFAFKEFIGIMPTRKKDRLIRYLVYLSIPIQYYWVSIGWYGMFIIFIPIYIFLFLPAVMVLLGETKGFIKSVGNFHWVVMLTVFSISHVAYLIKLPEKNPDAGSIGLILYLLLLTEFNDVSQFIWGKCFGKHKIVPKVSPNKTWEGFLGGLITITLIAGFIAPYLTPMNRLYGFYAGIVISVSGFIGDTVISSVKRDLNIKDSGSIIPGHGGILDRIDSLLYTSPLFFHFMHYFYY
ncbi:MAG: phosphatidate cytidylyltransferase [Desulfobacterales bacterium]|nr:phosphatidate cytidylyltransferase [Desulfobacterales bacterium]